MADSTGVCRDGARRWASAPGPSLGELDGLRARHPRWLISWARFGDGWNYDAKPLDERRPRLVVKTAAELDGQIAAVENGTWRPAVTSAEDFELARTRERHPLWAITREGPYRFTADDGMGREVTGRSARELGVLLDGRAWAPRTGRNPGLPPGAG
jgi:hypothetical protein